MRIDPVEPPREFEVTKRGDKLTHVADVTLADDELVTFLTDSGSEYDVVRKAWGYYATPSLNGRLREQGLRAALCAGQPRETGQSQRMYLLLVQTGCEDRFQAYAEAEGMRVVAWLDDDGAVAEAARKLES
jgi:hypothetical protein